MISFWAVLGLIVVIFNTSASALFGYWQFNVVLGLFIGVMAIGMGGFVCNSFA